MTEQQENNQPILHNHADCNFVVLQQLFADRERVKLINTDCSFSNAKAKASHRSWLPKIQQKNHPRFSFRDPRSLENRNWLAATDPKLRSFLLCISLPCR